jgi:hypothetical protein
MIYRTSVNNYQHTLHNSQEEQGPHLSRGGSLKSGVWFLTDRTGVKLYGITMIEYFTDFPFLLIFRILFLFLHSALIFIECTYTLLLSVSLSSCYSAMNCKEWGMLCKASLMLYLYPSFLAMHPLIVAKTPGTDVFQCTKLDCKT